MILKTSLGFKVYVDPTHDECMQLPDCWDTLRICYDPDRDVLAFADGYGATHSTVVDTVGDRRRFFPDTYIVHVHNGKVYANLEDVSGKMYAPLRHLYELLGERASLTIEMICVRRQERIYA